MPSRNVCDLRQRDLPMHMHMKSDLSESFPSIPPRNGIQWERKQGKRGCTRSKTFLGEEEEVSFPPNGDCDDDVTSLNGMDMSTWRSLVHHICSA